MRGAAAGDLYIFRPHEAAPDLRARGHDPGRRMPGQLHHRGARRLHHHCRASTARRSRSRSRRASSRASTLRQRGAGMSVLNGRGRGDLVARDPGRDPDQAEQGAEGILEQVPRNRDRRRMPGEQGLLRPGGPLPPSPSAPRRSHPFRTQENAGSAPRLSAMTSASADHGLQPVDVHRSGESGAATRVRRRDPTLRPVTAKLDPTDSGQFAREDARKACKSIFAIPRLWRVPGRASISARYSAACRRRTIRRAIIGRASALGLRTGRCCQRLPERSRQVGGGSTIRDSPVRAERSRQSTRSKPVRRTATARHPPCSAIRSRRSSRMTTARS